jgi:hypothetical protein
VRVFGVYASEWVTLFNYTFRRDEHLGYVFGGQWPDGEPLFDQESIMIDAMDIIKQEFIEWLKASK